MKVWCLSIEQESGYVADRLESIHATKEGAEREKRKYLKKHEYCADSDLTVSEWEVEP